MFPDFVSSQCCCFAAVQFILKVILSLLRVLQWCVKYGVEIRSYKQILHMSPLFATGRPAKSRTRVGSFVRVGCSGI